MALQTIIILIPILLIGIEVSKRVAKQRVKRWEKEKNLIDYLEE